MSEKKPAGRGRRFSDMLGLTEPGQPAPRNSPRLSVLLGFISLILGISYLALALTRFSAGKSDWLHIIFGLVYIGVGAGFLIGWIRGKNRKSD